MLRHVPLLGSLAAARAPEAAPSILLKPANLTALPESVAAAERRKALGGAAVFTYTDHWHAPRASGS